MLLIRMKKGLGSFMVAVLLQGAVSMIALPAANAADPIYDGLGTGTGDDPYQISTPAQLDSVRNFLGACFILTDDIDLGAGAYNVDEGWVPIGTDSAPFHGTMNGNGFKITNLTLDRNANNQGLFGYTNTDSRIDHMALEQVKISNIATEVGSLVGWNKGVISDSYAIGVVDGFHDVGGLVGVNEGVINNSYTKGSLISDNYYVGGLVGTNVGEISNSYSDADLIVDTMNPGTFYRGGLVGVNSGTIGNSYASGIVEGFADTGGLVGQNNAGTITASFAIGQVNAFFETGGLVGQNSGSISTSYYDSEINGMDDAGLGDGLSTTAIKLQSSSMGWDYSIVWKIDPSMNDGYPALRPAMNGGGTALFPYQIKEAYQLDAVRNYYLRGPSHFILDNDINLDVSPYNTGEGWDPIESNHTPFNGSLDGNGHRITGLMINRPAEFDLGLFKHLDNGAEIKNLAFTDVDIIDGSYMGSLAGIMYGGSVTNIYVTGSVKGTNDHGGLIGEIVAGTLSDAHMLGEVRGTTDVGGLVGHGVGGLIENSSVAAEVIGASGVGGIMGSNNAAIVDHSYAAGNINGTGNGVGGLVGTSFGTITYSYATGQVTGNSQNVGGLTGFNGGVIENSYASGNVTGLDDVGGLVGYQYTGHVLNSYAIGKVSASTSNAGGLAGKNDGVAYTGSYYDSDTTLQAESGSVEGKSTEEMKLQGTYANWDFATIWGIDSQRNNGYPYLRAIQLPVTYDWNGGTGGTVPSDEQLYSPGVTVSVYGNVGNLTKNGYTFDRWNTAADGSGTSYTPNDTFSWTDKIILYAQWLAKSDNAELGGVILSQGTLTAQGATDYTASVGNAVDSLTVTPTAADPTATVTVNGIPVVSGNASGSIHLNVGINMITIVVTAQNGTPKTYTITVTRAEGSGNTPSQPATPTVPPQPMTPTVTGVDVLVNGKPGNAGTATASERDGQTVLTISVDQKKLEDKLDSEAPGSVVTIPVDAKTDVVVVELNGRTVKNMEDKQTVIEIKTNRGTYTLPALQIDIDSLSIQWGKKVDLKDIHVQIEIGEPAADTVKMAEDAAEKGSFSLVVQSLNFTIRAAFEGSTVEVSAFDVYVERTIAIPDGVDPNRITTAVAVDQDGSVRHVPTKIVTIDGKYHARINSLTNSTYAVVFHPLVFQDVANHWAKDAINDMGSRMVVEGAEDGLFHPDRGITRSEFAAIIVRGLGLKPDHGATPFSDVKATDWYSHAINTAYAYDLIDGFEDGTFRPNDKITREQGMVILSKAMKITSLKAALPVQSIDVILRSYPDAAESSAWALSGIADSIQSGIVSGRSGSKLAPKADMTRAEVAVMIRRLLQQSGLI